MKHNLKITIVLLAMFLVTQFIGLYVVNYYSPVKVIDSNAVNVSAPPLPYGMDTPDIEEELDFYRIFPSIIMAFVIAISLLFLLSRFKAEFVLRLWFFGVVLIALGISFSAFFPQFKHASLIALLVALPLAIMKIYGRDLIVHNLTELFIYPGIAAVFVPILNVWTITALLILISIYDMWAVWHSGIMQKMAKYQINHLNIFSGFFVPYLSKKTRLKKEKMQKSRKYKTKKEFWKMFKNIKFSRQKGKKALRKKIKVNVAILGGGDVVFPIIAAGVMLKTLGIGSALFVIAGATIGLSYLFFLAEKKKFYPAMPFISAGIFAGMILGYLIS